ncbi:MAG: hypothetical protein Roseis2KO_16260 [Roseivirga sp.]
MENTTQFKLEEQIAAWRSELAGSGNISREDLDELESHLLDEVEQLTDCPLTEREAFMVAKDRIGTDAELSQSYARSKSLWLLFKSRSTLYLQAVLVLIIISLMSRMIEFATIMTIASFELPMAWSNYLYSGLLLTGCSVLFLWFSMVSRRAGRQARRISLTGNLTLMTLIVAALTILLGIRFTAAPIELELIGIFFIRQYIWAAGMLIILIASIIYSVRDMKSPKPGIA